MTIERQALPVDLEIGPMLAAGVRIDTAAEPPRGVSAVVVEEDTYLVLSADPEVRITAEHPIRLLHELSRLEPLVPGSVVVRQGSPLGLLAVIHDLGLDPTWRRSWIDEALDDILLEVRSRGLLTLAMPILGTVHGRLPRNEGLSMLLAALARHRGGGLRRLFVVA